MKKLLLLFLLATGATAQTNNPWVQQGNTVKPIAGVTSVTVDNQKTVRYGELSSNGTNYVAIQAPASVTGDRTWTLQDSTDVFVGRATTDTLTNKTLTTPVILDYLDMEEQSSSPATPAAGFRRLYPKTDGKWYAVDELGTEVSLIDTLNTQTLQNKTLTTPTINGATLSIDDTDSAFVTNLVSTSSNSSDRTLTFDVNNGSRTLELSGNLIKSGSDPLTLVTTATTSVTLPTTGTLATLAGAENLTNKTVTAPVFAGQASGSFARTVTGGSVGIDFLPSSGAQVLYGLNFAVDDSSATTGSIYGLLIGATQSGAGTASTGILVSNATTSGHAGAFLEGGAGAIVAGALAADPAIVAYQEIGSSGAALSLQNATAFDTQAVNISAPAATVGTAEWNWTLPPDDGAANTFMKTDGAGVSTWSLVGLTNGVTGILPTANGGTGQNSTATFPTSGTVAVTDTAQTFTGVQKFSGGMVDTTNRDATDGNVTLTNTSKRHQIFTGFSASREVTLPTTSIVSGEVFIIENTTTQDLVLKSSGGNTIDTIATGYIIVSSTQATPTTAAHWPVMNVYEVYSHVSNFTFTGTATTGNKTLKVVRHNKATTVHLPNSLNVTSASASGVADSNTDLPSRFVPTTDHQTWCFVRDNGVDTNGYVKVSPSGNVQVGEAPNTTFAGGAGGNTGIENGVAVTYAN